MTQHRTDWIDYAKAIGIILVVYGHITRGLFRSNIEMASPVFKVLDSVVYSFHMPLFFFLSGLFFVHSFSRRGASGFILGKLDSVIYPYIVWSILQGCIEVFLSRHSNGSVSLSEVFSLLWQPRAQFWFLYALFLVCVFATLVFSLFSRRFIVPVFLIAAALYLFPTFLSQYIIPNFIFGHFVFFSAGILFTSHLKIELFSSSIALVVSTLAFIAGQWMFHVYFAMENSDKDIFLLTLTFVSILFVVSLSAHLSTLKIEVLAHIGASSMAIFLIHILAGSGTRILLIKFFGIHSFSVHLIAGSLLAIIIPMLVLTITNSLRIPGIFSSPFGKFIANSHKQTPQRNSF